MGSTEGISDGKRRISAVEKLRSMLADPDKFIACPGVYDGFTARIALNEGVDCLYMVRPHTAQATSHAPMLRLESNISRPNAPSRE